jgi:hypothetical protein
MFLTRKVSIMWVLPSWLFEAPFWIVVIVLEVALVGGLVYALIRLNRLHARLNVQLPTLNRTIRQHAKDLRALHTTIDAIGGQLLTLLSWATVQKVLIKLRR